MPVATVIFFSAPQVPLNFPGWPSQFEGKTLKQLPESETIHEFSREFPGKIALFSDGRQTICFRWVIHETRRLHPASDCYKSLGYKVDWKPSQKSADEKHWNCFECHRLQTSLAIRESIFDSAGTSWADVSAWYWAAFFTHTLPPWWSVTVIRRTSY
jgi:hypothetical protein